METRDRVAGFWCVLLFAGSLMAQSTLEPSAAVAAFRDSVVKQRLLARGFSGDSEVRYQWDGSGLVMSKPEIHTLGAVEVSSVKLKDGRIEIKGKRRTLMKNSKGDLTLSEEEIPVLLAIHLGKDSPESVLPQLKAKLFFEDVDHALLDIPPIYKKILPSQARTADQNLSKANPSPTEVPECPGDPAQMTPPKSVHFVHPDLPLQDQQHGYSGAVSLVYTVGDTGRVSDIWLGIPADRGLNEVVIRSVRDEMFRPATCAGKPVSVALEMSIEIGRQ